VKLLSPDAVDQVEIKSLNSWVKTLQPITNMRIKEAVLHKAPVDPSEATEQAVKEAERRAYEKGVEDGIASVCSERRETADRLKVIFSSLQDYQDSLSDQMAEDCVKLAVMIASKILAREITCKDILTQVENALKQTGNRRDLTLRLNPEDFESVAHEIKTSSIGADLANLNLVADVSVTPGGCAIDGPFGRIDARMETQLREIENALLNEKLGANCD